MNVAWASMNFSAELFAEELRLRLVQLVVRPAGGPFLEQREDGVVRRAVEVVVLELDAVAGQQVKHPRVVERPVVDIVAYVSAAGARVEHQAIGKSLAQHVRDAG